MDRYLSTLVLTFCVALGVNLGGSLLGSLGALITRRPPLHTMMELSAELKIWALVAALGGTFSIIKVFETGMFEKQLSFSHSCVRKTVKSSENDIIYPWDLILNSALEGLPISKRLNGEIVIQ